MRALALVALVLGCGGERARDASPPLRNEAPAPADAAPPDAMDPIALGKALYERKGCASCHNLDGAPKVGPSWKGIWGTTVKLADGSERVVDEAYIKASIQTPSAFGRPGYPIGTMPSFEGQLREGELEALIELIKSLKNP